jgi:hypothetical protein
MRLVMPSLRSLSVTRDARCLMWTLRQAPKAAASPHDDVEQDGIALDILVQTQCATCPSLPVTQ